MTRTDEHRIADIIDAAKKLAERLDVPFETWLEDEDLRLVNEQLVEVIGEAARAMTQEGRDAWPSIDWTGLIGLRNVLVHAYHRIQPDLLWQAAPSTSPPSPLSSRAQRPSGAREDRSTHRQSQADQGQTPDRATRAVNAPNPRAPVNPRRKALEVVA